MDCEDSIFGEPEGRGRQDHHGRQLGRSASGPGAGVQVHFFALAGLSILWGLVDRIKVRVNPGLRISGMVPIFYNARETQSLEVVEKLRQAFGELIFETVIHRNTDTVKAAGWAEAVVTAAPRTLGGQDYLALADVFLRRQEKEEVEK